MAVSTPPSTSASPPESQDTTTMPQRIAQRKAAFKLQLTAAAQKDIASKCQVAQAGLQQLKTKESPNQAKRQQIYADLTKRLSTAVDRLKRQSIDTTGLEADRIKFNKAIDQFSADFSNYSLAMDDTIVIDCVSDPLGFKVSILSARQIRAQLMADSAAIKSLVPPLRQSLQDTQQALIKSTDSNQQGVN